MESNYMTHGCDVRVTAVAGSDQHRELGKGTVAMHTYPRSTLQHGTQPSPPTPRAQSISGELLKTTCKIERATLTLNQRYWPENAIVLWVTVWEEM